MKREIKFRAWNSARNEMYLNCGFHPHLLSDLSYEDEHYNDNLEGRYIVHNDDCYTLMQFTGLKDKNGVEIYEGDIVTDSLFRMENIDVIEWVDCGWSTKDSEKWEYKGFDEIALRGRFEIIGNVYEKPDLLC